MSQKGSRARNGESQCKRQASLGEREAPRGPRGRAGRSQGPAHSGAHFLAQRELALAVEAARPGAEDAGAEDDGGRRVVKKWAPEEDELMLRLVRAFCHRSIHPSVR